jgi:hypothetical protein
MMMLRPKKRETPKPKPIGLSMFIIPKVNLSSLNDTISNNRIISPLKTISKNGGRFIFIPQR